MTVLFIALHSRVISGSNLEKNLLQRISVKIYIKAASHIVLLGVMGNKLCVESNNVYLCPLCLGLFVGSEYA